MQNSTKTGREVERWLKTLWRRQKKTKKKNSVKQWTNEQIDLLQMYTSAVCRSQAAQAWVSVWLASDPLHIRFSQVHIPEWHFCSPRALMFSQIACASEEILYFHTYSDRIIWSKCIPCREWETNGPSRDATEKKKFTLLTVEWREHCHWTYAMKQYWQSHWSCSHK